MLKIKPISSLEKVFLDTPLNGLAAIKTISMYKNERLSFQIAYTETDPTRPRRYWVKPIIEGELAKYATVRTVECVPVRLAVYPNSFDDNYLRVTPGLYPDLLQPLHMDGLVPVVGGVSHAIWIELDPCGEAMAGDTTLTVKLVANETISAETTLDIKVIDAMLPEQKMPVTQWFHCDCLADYYGVEMFSERHWKIIDAFIATAVRNGVDTMLTPVFTPPLDTAVGYERPTAQLVGVTAEKTADGTKYSFDFTALDRWVKMCDRNGVRFFEISHLFTQWGAAHAPKIVATVVENGTQRVERIFGWDTVIDSTDCEYARFLRSFLAEFIGHMKRNGNDKRCIWHISDEPNVAQIEQYALSRSIVADLLKDYVCMDALANYEFYRQGFVTTPVVSNNSMRPFIENETPNLWTYYCCSQGVGTSNRFIAMPGARTRFMGTQCYCYKIAGFLQWGYNFYYNQGSRDLVNPFLDTSGDYFVPAGDTFSVYPAPDGRAWESMRIVQFHEGLQDMRAMELCESLIGRDETMRIIENAYGRVIFEKCPYTSEQMLRIRRAIDEAVARALENKVCL